MKTKAYSYIRMSTKKQAKEGKHSYARQIGLRNQYLEKNPELELDQDINLYDPGVPSLHGQNLDPRRGYLGKFINACRNGEIRNGSYLIMESIDRFSRSQTTQVIRLITELVCDYGLTIVFLEPKEQIITEETLNKDLSELLYIVISASSAHMESVRKAYHARKNWEKARARARENPDKKLTKRCPSWLEYNERTKKFEEIRHKADAVRKVFDLSASGMGTVSIAKTMNETTPPISTHDTGGKPRRWNKSFISVLLKDRSVLGEYQPKSWNHDKKIRETKGEPIKGYYPAIISEELFYASRTAMALNRKTRKNTNTEFINLFRGLVVNATDGSTMQIGTSRVRRSSGEAYVQRRLYSYEYTRTGSGCPWSLDYFMLEDLVLHSLIELKPKDFEKENRRPQELRNIEQKIIGLKEAIAGYDKQFKNPKFRTMFDDILTAKVNLQNELVKEQEKYDQLLSSTTGNEISFEQDYENLKTLLGKEELFVEKDQRVNLVQVIPNFINQILVVPVKFKNRQVGGFGSVLMQNEEVRNFVICKQRKLNRRMLSTLADGRVNCITTPNGYVFFENEIDGPRVEYGKQVFSHIKNKKTKELRTNSVSYRSAKTTRDMFAEAEYFGGYGPQYFGENLFQLDRNPNRK